MRFVFQVEVELEHSQGKFAGRDELSDKIMEELPDPGQIEGDNGGEYNVIGWDVTDISGS